MAQLPTSPSTPDTSMQALKEYGGYIISAILLVLLGYFGWTYWQNNLARVDTVAADQYADIQLLNDEINLTTQNPDLNEQAQQALAADQATLEQRINTLVNEHGSSVYAWQALLIKARQQADAGDFAAANDSLKSALAIDLKDAGLQALTQLRYAQSLLAAGEADEALGIANNKMPSSFEGSKQELLGDIYVAKNDKEAAIQAYNNAWGLLSKRQENRAVLALKMESLGMTPEPIEPSASLIQMPNTEMMALAQAAMQQQVQASLDKMSIEADGLTSEPSMTGEQTAETEAANTMRADMAIVDTNSSSNKKTQQTLPAAQDTADADDNAAQ